LLFSFLMKVKDMYYYLSHLYLFTFSPFDVVTKEKLHWCKARLLEITTSGYYCCPSLFSINTCMTMCHFLKISHEKSSQKTVPWSTFLLENFQKNSTIFELKQITCANKRKSTKESFFLASYEKNNVDPGQ